ncbi:MAG: hypothetical protein KA436_11740 [Oligoflexales bacterium]|nr:hypothetical protein [Oligoflexales bacterium]
MVFNGAQFHMLVNHVPVVGFLGVTLVLLMAIKVKSIEMKRFALLATALVGTSSLASYWTGEPAEEVVEHLTGVTEGLIHEHEELAEKATVISIITAAMAAIAFFLQRKKPETLKVSLPIVLLFSLITASIMGMAAHEGGKIRHPEINPNAGSLGSSHETIED